MKIVFAVCIFLMSPLAFAASILCQMENTDQTLLLQKIRDLPIPARSNLDSRAEYSLQLQTTELPAPAVNVKGIATSADVQFNFKSADGQYFVSMYMDDAAGTLKINRKEYTFSDCKFF